LLDIFKAGIFASNDPLGRMDVFLVSYAHLLPGSINIQGETAMIELLLNFLADTEKWPLFANHIVEATNAFCATICAAAMENPDVASDFTVYLGFVLEVLENEQRLWELLPSSLAADLRTACHRCLIHSIKDDFFFADRSESIWRDAFFENLGNLGALGFLCEAVFCTSDLQSDILSAMAGYFHKKLQRLVADVTGRATLAAVAVRVCETMIDTFERIDILSEQLPRAPQARVVLDSLRGALLAAPELRIENCMSQYIGRCICAMCDDRGQCRDQRRAIRRCARVIAFVPDRRKFVRRHGHAMIVRLFQCAGVHYRVEEMVLGELQPFLPPTLSLPFEERTREFAASGDVNAQWRAEMPDSPLHVLVLPAVKSGDIRTVFAHVRLPEPFAEMQRLFEAFYGRLAGTSKVRFQWICEDNIVSIRLEAPEKYSIRLKVPLIVAVVFVLVWRYTDASAAKIADLAGLDVRQVEAIVRQAASRQFPLIVVRDGKISFNPAFKTKRRKLRIVQPGFSLRKPPKEEAKVEDGRSAMRQSYQLLIMRIMKSTRTLEIDRLTRRVERELAKQSVPFRRDEYEQALMHLEGMEFIRKDPARPNQYLYVT
jgi:hypothetical protein